MSKEESRTAITEDQLFQQFTKSNQVCSNSFQLLFDGVKQINAENQFLKALLEKNGIKLPNQPLPQGTIIPKITEPNRQQRRKAEREAKKNDKPAK
jgi:hypothetical protein